jgi:transcriptional regulator with XRE-family HTH domain
MPTGRKLTDDVSIEELLRMREEEGLSNYEIAQRVGVAKNTIYRLIGKQPPHVRDSYGRQSAAKARNAAPVQNRRAEEEIVPASLVMEIRVVRLIGHGTRYEVNEVNGDVLVIRNDETAFKLEREELDDFIKELQAIQRHTKQLNPMEAW